MRGAALHATDAAGNGLGLADPGTERSSHLPGLVQTGQKRLTGSAAPEPKEAATVHSAGKGRCEAEEAHVPERVLPPSAAVDMTLPRS
jgi:hypothetical protein